MLAPLTSSSTPTSCSPVLAETGSPAEHSCAEKGCLCPTGSSPGLLFALVEDQLGYWSRRSPHDVDLPGRLRAAQLCQFASQVDEVLRKMALSDQW